MYASNTYDKQSSRSSSRNRTSQRSPSPAYNYSTVENGLTRLSISDSGKNFESTRSAVGATLKVSLQEQQDRSQKVRHLTDPMSSRNRDRQPSVRQHSPQNVASAGNVDPGKKQKTLSFSETHLVSQSSTSILSPKTLLSSSGSSSGSSSALTSGGRRIHIVLPGTVSPAVTGTDATPDDIITPDSLKSVSKPSTDDTDNVKSKKGKQQRTPKKESKQQYETYMKLDEVQQGLKRGELIEGVLRINPKNYQDAYISVPDGPDIYVGGIRDRNRSLNGDVVVVQLKPHSEWKILHSDFRNYLARNFNNVAGVTLLTPFINVSKTLRPIRKTESKSKEFKSKVVNPATMNEKNDTGWATWETPCGESADQVLPTRQTSSKTRRLRGKKKKKKNSKGNCGSGVEVNQSLCPDFPVIANEVFENFLVKGDSDLSCNARSLPNAFDVPVPPVTTFQCLSTLCANIDPKPVTDSNDKSEETVPLTLLDNNCTSLPNDTETNLLIGEQSQNLSLTSRTCPEFATQWEEPTKFGKSDKEQDGWSRAVAESQVAIVQLEDFLMECQSSSRGMDVDEREFDEEAFVDLSGVVLPHQLSEVEDSVSDSGSSFILDDSRLAIEDAQFLSSDTHLDDMVPRETADANVGSVEESPSVSDSALEALMISDSAGVPLPFRDEHPALDSVSLGDQYYPGGRQRRISSESNCFEEQACNDCFNIIKDILSKKILEEFTVSDFMRLPNGTKFLQRTAEVVYVLEHKNTGFARGYLKPMKDGNDSYILFSPIDNKMPRMKIPRKQCPPDFVNNYNEFAETLFVARLLFWNSYGLPMGELVKCLDDNDFIKKESEGILYENNVEFINVFDSEVLTQFSVDSAITQEEIDKRVDFRQTCVFSIDPQTARDLDDALSCDLVEDGLYRVGVHIADVSHFVQENSKLDQIASRLATSVYLVQMVVPMLPPILSEHLCSLNPGVDRLTFSVQWLIREDGAILHEWFGRSVIKSCAKLSYDHAQDVIDHGGDVNTCDFPPIAGGWKPEDVAKKILCLHRLAVLLRKKRIDNGALRLDQVKLGFHRDPFTGMPVDFFEYVIRDSHRLVEEFMLLTNVAVSQKIYRTFPDDAVLRRHPSPREKSLEEIVQACKHFGIFLDVSSSFSLQKSLTDLASSNSELAIARVQVIMMQLTKPMECAIYFRSGSLKDTTNTWHYALNVPVYTHFTSPIRRYPDILVHRLLAAAIGLAARPNATPQSVHKQLVHCNDRKLTAKRVSELSSELFLSVYIKSHGEIEERGMVCYVYDRSFDVLILKMGIVKRIYCEQLPLDKCEYLDTVGVKRLILDFQSSNEDSSNFGDAVCVMKHVELTQFSIVNVILTASGTPLKIHAAMKYPVLSCI